MLEGKYSLRYISRYAADLIEIVDYLVFQLHNPNAAKNLIDKIENAIIGRLSCPLSFEPFQSSRKRKNLYYRIYVDNVDNFIIYYVVIDNIMEVRRIRYKGRDTSKLIK